MSLVPPSAPPPAPAGEPGADSASKDVRPFDWRPYGAAAVFLAVVLAARMRSPAPAPSAETPTAGLPAQTPPPQPAPASPLPLPPAEDSTEPEPSLSDGSLVPWDGSVREQPAARPAPSAAPLSLFGGRFGSAIRGQREEFARRVRSAVAEHRRDPKSRYVEVEDLVLAPRAYLGLELETAGWPFFVSARARTPHFTLGDGHGVGAQISVSMQGLPLERQKALLTAKIIILRGRWKSMTTGESYLEASGFEDLGEPVGAPTISEVLYERAWLDAEPERTATELRAALESAKADREHRLVRIEDLIVDPAALLDRSVSVVGTPMHPQVSSKGAYFKMAPDFGNASSIDVLLARLPLDAQKAAFRSAWPPSLSLVKGVLRRSANGAFYLDADGFSFISRSQGSAAKLLREKP